MSVISFHFVMDYGLVLVLCIQITVILGELCVQDRGGGCELYCEQTSNDTRLCSCGSLGELKNDKVRCYYKPRLMFGQDGGLTFLKQAQVFGIHKRTETIHWNDVIKDGGSVWSLTQSYNERLIIYASKHVTSTHHVSTIGYVNVGDRTHKEIFQENKAEIYGVAYDSKTKKLYYTLSNGQIMQVHDYHSEVSRGKKLFATMERPKDVEIDSMASSMFVADISSKEIVRFDLITGEKILVVNTSLHIPECIALDLVAEKLFWVGRRVEERDRIETSNYDGSCRRLLKSVNSHNPFAMTFWNGLLFWSDVAKKKIYETNVTNGNTVDTNIVLEHSALSIQYFGHRENFTGEWSGWSTGGNATYRTCERPRLHSVTCLSPPLRKDKFTCDGISTKPYPEKDLTKNTKETSVDVGIGVVAGIVFLALLIIFFVYKKRNKNKAVRLDNRDIPEPIYGFDNRDIPEPIYAEIDSGNSQNVDISTEADVITTCSGSSKQTVELTPEKKKVYTMSSRSHNRYSEIPPRSPSCSDSDSDAKLHKEIDVEGNQLNPNMDLATHCPKAFSNMVYDLHT